MLVMHLLASGHLWLRNLRDEKSCVLRTPDRFFFSVNLSDGIQVDLNHLKMLVIPKDYSSYCSSNPYLPLSVSFLPLTGVRRDKKSCFMAHLGPYLSEARWAVSMDFL